MSIKIELPARYGHTHEELSFIREMGVNYLNLNVMPDHMGYEDMAAEVERLAKYDIRISDLACPPLQKNADIILGRPGKDEAIARFQEFVRTAGKLNIPLVSVAWQPNGIFRTARAAGKHTRGGTAFLADQAEIEARPISNDREYGHEEVWENFRYFLERMIPVCEENNVVMALHPNDPPLPSLGGAASLIYTTEGYRKALAMAGNSPALAVKMCVGCWLEAPGFGNLMEDIAEFARMGRLCEVHFRNVSCPLPNFEETLLEDGYANMLPILKQFVDCGFDGFMSVDHGFKGYPSTGGELASLAYPTGYLKGMLSIVEGKWK